MAVKLFECESCILYVLSAESNPELLAAFFLTLMLEC